MVLDRVVVSDEAIDNIVAIALEGAIDYWCYDVAPVGAYLGRFASEQISRGGVLNFYLYDAKTFCPLDKKSFLEGVEKYVRLPNAPQKIDYEGRIKSFYVDSTVADCIIQLALFGELVYG